MTEIAKKLYYSNVLTNAAIWKHSMQIKWFCQNRKAYNLEDGILNRKWDKHEHQLTKGILKSQEF